MSKTDHGRRQQEAAGARQPKPPAKDQHQESRGVEWKLDPQPTFRAEAYRPAGKLADSPYNSGAVLQVMGGETTGG